MDVIESQNDPKPLKIFFLIPSTRFVSGYSWRSDIAFIYTRASLATALEASARLAQVDGGDIEAAFSAWAEPAI